LPALMLGHLLHQEYLPVKGTYLLAIARRRRSRYFVKARPQVYGNIPAKHTRRDQNAADGLAAKTACAISRRRHQGDTEKTQTDKNPFLQKFT
ncbi:MAG: hypothetical protein K8R91_04140, partial [Phycisphaerae bacterium]|nr:hypothetical protein [Phycisphaerae bacterium]